MICEMPLIEEITVRGRANPPQIVAGLIEGFLQRPPLPRLLHFVDLALPQMVPVSSPSHSSKVTFPGSQLVRDQWIAEEQGRTVKTTNIVVTRLFKSHAAIDHLTVHWSGMPLLLFADMNTHEYASVWEYQFAKAVTTLRQNVTMGLKKGNTVLFHFSFLGVRYQAILMMAGSIPGPKGGESQRKLWKHIAPANRICIVATRSCGSVLSYSVAARPQQTVWQAG